MIQQIKVTRLDLPLGTLSLAVGDDAAAGDLTIALKLASEPVLVDAPAEVSDEEVLDTLFCDLGDLGLCLLDDGLSLFFSLALLGGSFLLIVAGVR
jgi:hypothetical protein